MCPVARLEDGDASAEHPKHAPDPPRESATLEAPNEAPGVTS
jgi:hypothetical protein